MPPLRHVSALEGKKRSVRVAKLYLSWKRSCYLGKGRPSIIKRKGTIWNRFSRSFIQNLTPPDHHLHRLLTTMGKSLPKNGTMSKKISAAITRPRALPILTRQFLTTDHAIVLHPPLHKQVLLLLSLISSRNMNGHRSRFLDSQANKQPITNHFLLRLMDLGGPRSRSGCTHLARGLLRRCFYISFLDDVPKMYGACSVDYGSQVPSPI